MRTTTDITEDYIVESNLIEGVKGDKEVEQSMLAWKFLKQANWLTDPVVRRTHKLIMQNLLNPPHPGSYREVDVFVGNRKCLDPLLIEEYISHWIHVVNDGIQQKIYQPSALHVAYERIHPFIDGNGRTGRMFMWWQEIKMGYTPTLIPFADRFKYYKWFDQQ